MTAPEPMAQQRPAAPPPTSAGLPRGGPWQWGTTVVASLVLALPIAASKVVEAVLKSTNPDGVDVRHGLAYLRPILVTAWAMAAVVVLAAVVGLVLTRKKEGGAAARLPLMVLGGQVLAVLVILAASAFVPG